MTTQAETFNQNVPASVPGMIAAVRLAGGSRWGDVRSNSWKVEFEDGSYWSASVFCPEGMPAYYNGGPKANPAA